MRAAATSARATRIIWPITPKLRRIYYQATVIDIKRIAGGGGAVAAD
jgi:hypothetical protein